MVGCGTSMHAGDSRIAHVYDKIGPLEAYARMRQIGLMLGLEYATGGTMMVNGNKLVLSERDTQGKADIGKAAASANLIMRAVLDEAGPDLFNKSGLRCMRKPVLNRQYVSTDNPASDQSGIQQDSNTPALRFFCTWSHANTWPFIAT